MAEQINYRFGSAHGWDHNKPVPSEGDLVVVITDRGGQKDQVVRLVEDKRDRQTIEVSDDLNHGHGCHTRYKRRGDIRPLHHMDEVIIKDTKTVVTTPSSSIHYNGDEAVAQLKRHWALAFDDDAVGETLGFQRCGPGLKIKLVSFRDIDAIDYILDCLTTSGQPPFEMIIIDSGNKHGDEWKYIFHVQTKTGTFIQESHQRS